MCAVYYSCACVLVAVGDDAGGGGLIICFNIIIIIGLQPIFPDKKEHDTVTTYLTCYVNTLIVK